MNPRILIDGVEVDRETLAKWVEEDMAAFKAVLAIVKRHYDDMLRSMGVDPASFASSDPSYYAILFMLARTVYASVKVRVVYAKSGR